MGKLKEWLCFLIFAGHGYEIEDLGVSSARVRCRRCGRVSWY